MQKSVVALHKVILGDLSLFIPIFVSISVIIFRFLFRAYVAIYKVEVIGIYKSAIPFISCLGIVLGVFGWQNKDKSKPLLKVNLFCLTGILLNIGLLCSTQIIDLPKMTGKISNIFTYEANESGFGYVCTLKMHVDLPTSEFVERNLNRQDPILIINTTSNTVIYEQTGKWSWQKKIIDDSQLQPNQHIQVKWDGFLFLTSPAQVDAVEITILNQ
jgi:hypothetical protein